MAQPILMPKPGQMTEECTVIAWHKQVGDPVRRGDVLFEIETDKANMDVEAFSEGVLLEIVVQEGESVPVNSLCAWIGQPGEVPPDDVSAVTPPEPQPTAAHWPTPELEPKPMAEPTSEPGPAREPEPEPTPELEPVPTAGLASPPLSAAGSGAPAAVERPGGRIRISPRASRRAAELGVDPRLVRGSGPLGRITEQDIEASAVAAAGSRPTSGRLEDEVVDAPGRMREVSARRIAGSVSTMPHIAVTISVDMTRLVAMRAELRETGVPYALTDFILAATAQALVEFPPLNARTDRMSVWRRTHVNLGVAVSSADGLLVPVVRDADRLTIRELHDQVAALVEKARAGILQPDDLSGGTFTVWDLGMFAIEQFSSIVNPGESATLAVASVAPVPVVVGDGIGIRQIMKATLSADQRLVDGELAARFLGALRRRLEDVEMIRRATALA